MTVVLAAVCDSCGAEHRPERQVNSFSPGAIRTRAALHGWGRREAHGVVQDVCPACLQAAVPAQQRVVERLLARAAPQAPRSPAAAGVVKVAVPVHAALLDVEVATCRWCADGEHQWCQGCDCRACGA